MIRMLLTGGLLLTLTACGAHNPEKIKLASNVDKYDTRVVLDNSCPDSAFNLKSGNKNALVPPSVIGILAPIVVDKVIDWGAAQIKKIADGESHIIDTSAPVLIQVNDNKTMELKTYDNADASCIHIIRAHFVHSDQQAMDTIAGQKIKNLGFYFQGKIHYAVNAMLIEPVEIKLQNLMTSGVWATLKGDKKRDFIINFTIKNSNDEAISQAMLVFEKMELGTKLNKQALSSKFTKWLPLVKLENLSKAETTIAQFDVQIRETEEASKFLQAVAEIVAEGKEDIKTLVKEKIKIPTS